VDQPPHFDSELIVYTQDPESGEGNGSGVQHPKWFKALLSDPFRPGPLRAIVPFMLNLAFDGAPVVYSSEHGWHTVVDGQITPLPRSGSAKGKVTSLLTPKNGLPHLKSGRLTSNNPALTELIASGDRSEVTKESLFQLAEAILSDGLPHESDPWLSQLDWSTLKPKKAEKSQLPPVLWPKWYWDLTAPKKDLPPGTVDITIRTRYSPILLKLSWQGWPLFHSREHGWTFRVPTNEKFTSRTKSLTFKREEDAELAAMNEQQQPASGTRGESPISLYRFYKLPHKDGEKANVGNPLAKTFISYSQDGTMTSPDATAKDALDLNAQCSYWISVRDRVLKQMVVWQNGSRDLGFPRGPEQRKWGIILPQMITMGTVTRRAIEKTWLTASNAKKNRVGSELKAMVQAPDGYAIVGADVDSEELWISSVMGDAQFGVHGATAIGWMTLEGTKAAKTDLHSKTADILGISRNQAKVFNYSRIYGAGGKHAVLLLLQANPSMTPTQAKKLADQLYASTKGKNTHHEKFFGRKFWYGGTESFVFNKLEEIAISDHPRTPALGCGITYALSKEYLPSGYGKDYMPSRINWAVQSSGVDYLHLLIVSMEYLITKYNINARYLISVHDELRYLAAEEDKYRAALALQIANLWTRCLFAFKLGMDDLPQGVAWFSAVDVDKVLRKETDMPCVTPSHPDAIPPGESLDITQILKKTNNGSLWRDGRAMTDVPGGEDDLVGNLEGYTEPNCLAHRAESAAWLGSQASDNLREIKFLHKEVLGESVGQRGGKPESGPTRSVKGVSSGANAPKRKLGRVSSIGAPSDVERLVEAGLIG
jgi:DNA polymerase gamma 1